MTTTLESTIRIPASIDPEEDFDALVADLRAANIKYYEVNVTRNVLVLTIATDELLNFFNNARLRDWLI